MNKPNFFIIGAPKCGTTSMAAWLAEHPRVYMSSVKEPYYYSKDFSKNNKIFQKDTYYSLFHGAGEKHIVVGEASAGYLYSKVAVENIEKDIAGAKYLVLLRNPLEMVRSLHQQMLFDGDEDVFSFEKAWYLQGERELGKNIPDSCKEPSFLFYGKVCSVGSQMDRLLSLVSPDNVFAVLLDDVKVNPRQVWLSVQDFLGIPDDGRVSFPVRNKGKRRRCNYLRNINELYVKLQRWAKLPPIGVGGMSFLHKLNNAEQSKDPISKELGVALKDYFKSDVMLLGKIMGKDLSRWLL